MIQLREECDRNGHILIFDEIQCFGGFLGRGFFSADLFSVEADIITIGKALGQGFPVAACLYSEALSDLQHNEAEFTHGGQPPACSAALAGLKYVDENSAKIRDSYEKWHNVVDALKNTFGEHHVRDIGFFSVVDFKDEDQASSSIFTTGKSWCIFSPYHGGVIHSVQMSLEFRRRRRKASHNCLGIHRELS